MLGVIKVIKSAKKTKLLSACFYKTHSRLFFQSVWCYKVQALLTIIPLIFRNRPLYLIEGLLKILD